MTWSLNHDRHHLEHLKTVFVKLCQYKLKMNPLKCAFGVTFAKFLGFVIRHRGIEVGLAKMKAIIELFPPTNIRKLRGFQGRITYI